ncbi:hypothetical protein [Microcoleus sp. Pol12B4]
MKITRLFLLYIAGIRAGFGDRVSDFLRLPLTLGQNIASVLPNNF